MEYFQHNEILVSIRYNNGSEIRFIFNIILYSLHIFIKDKSINCILAVILSSLDITCYGHERTFIYTDGLFAPRCYTISVLGIPSRDLEFPLSVRGCISPSRPTATPALYSSALSFSVSQLNNENNSLLLLEYPVLSTMWLPHRELSKILRRSHCLQIETNIIMQLRPYLID